MTQPSNHLHPRGNLGLEPTARERIDARLDEALQETFPASDSSAIGSGIAIIKQEQREQRVIVPANVAKAQRSHVPQQCSGTLAGQPHD